MSKKIEFDFTNFHMSIDAGAITMQFDRSIETLTMDYELAYGVGMLLLHASGMLEYCAMKGIEPDQSMLPATDDHIAVVQLPPKFLQICKTHGKHPAEMLDALVGIFKSGNTDSAMYMMAALLNYLDNKDKKRAKHGVENANHGDNGITEKTSIRRH